MTIADFNEFVILIMDLHDFDDIKVEISDESDDDTINNNGVVCGDCGRNVKNEKCLKGHKKQFHEKVICPTCGIECVGWRKYHNHKRKHDSESCPKCHKQFTSDVIKRHTKKCKGLPKPKYACEVEECDFSTNLKKQFDRFVTHFTCFDLH